MRWERCCYIGMDIRMSNFDSRSFPTTMRISVVVKMTCLLRRLWYLLLCFTFLGLLGLSG